MNATRTRSLTAVLTLCALLAAGALSAAERPPADGSGSPRPAVLVFGLGSRCRYCVQLKQEIAKVTQITGDAVQFKDYRVDRDQEMVRKYRVVLSPTLVFLDAGGTEVFRHQGLLDAAQIRERLVALRFWGGKG